MNAFHAGRPAGRPTVTPDFQRFAVEAVGRLAAGADVLAEGVAVRDAVDYPAIFANWERSASVRRSRPVGAEEESPAGPFFPPEMVPAYEHPLVAALGAAGRGRLLVYSLYQYLHFTSELESLTVIPAAIDLARGRSGVPIPEPARRDAFIIVTDEAWHAQFSDALQHEIAKRAGVPVPTHPEPLFVQRLHRIAEQLRGRVPVSMPVLSAIVSETLVSALLAEIPHDTRLPAMVRRTVADHARDEGRHHAYFKIVLRRLWSSLSAVERSALGPWIPSIILAFLEPDYRAIAHWLTALGLDTGAVEAVLTESYPRQRVLRVAADAARSTIRYFTELGALSDPATADAFAVLTTAEGS